MKIVNKNQVDILTKEIIDFRKNRNWKQYHSPKNMVISFYIEIAELAEYFQYGSDDFFKDKNTYNDKIADEIIDIFWWTLLVAHEYNINLKKIKGVTVKTSFSPRNSLISIFASIGKISSELSNAEDVIQEKYITKNKGLLKRELENIFNQASFFANFIKVDIKKEFFRKLEKNERKYPIKRASPLTNLFSKLSLPYNKI